MKVCIFKNRAMNETIKALLTAYEEIIFILR